MEDEVEEEGRRWTWRWTRRRWYGEKEENGVNWEESELHDGHWPGGSGFSTITFSSSLGLNRAPRLLVFPPFWMSFRDSAATRVREKWE